MCCIGDMNCIGDYQGQFGSDLATYYLSAKDFEMSTECGSSIGSIGNEGYARNDGIGDMFTANYIGCNNIGCEAFDRNDGIDVSADVSILPVIRIGEGRERSDNDAAACCYRKADSYAGCRNSPPAEEATMYNHSVSETAYTIAASRRNECKPILAVGEDDSDSGLENGTAFLRTGAISKCSHELKSSVDGNDLSAAVNSDDAVVTDCERSCLKDRPVAIGTALLGVENDTVSDPLYATCNEILNAPDQNKNSIECISVDDDTLEEPAWKSSAVVETVQGSLVGPRGMLAIDPLQKDISNELHAADDEEQLVVACLHSDDGMIYRAGKMESTEEYDDAASTGQRESDMESEEEHRPHGSISLEDANASDSNEQDESHDVVHDRLPSDDDRVRPIPENSHSQRDGTASEQPTNACRSQVSSSYLKDLQFKQEPPGEAAQPVGHYVEDIPQANATGGEVTNAVSGRRRRSGCDCIRIPALSGRKNYLWKGLEISCPPAQGSVEFVLSELQRDLPDLEPGCRKLSAVLHALPHGTTFDDPVIVKLPLLLTTSSESSIHIRYSATDFGQIPCWTNTGSPDGHGRLVIDDESVQFRNEAEIAADRSHVDLFLYHFCSFVVVGIDRLGAKQATAKVMLRFNADLNERSSTSVVTVLVIVGCNRELLECEERKYCSQRQWHRTAKEKYFFIYNVTTKIVATINDVKFDVPHDDSRLQPCTLDKHALWNGFVEDACFWIRLKTFSVPSHFAADINITQNGTNFGEHVLHIQLSSDLDQLLGPESVPSLSYPLLFNRTRRPTVDGLPPPASTTAPPTPAGDPTRPKRKVSESSCRRSKPVRVSNSNISVNLRLQSDVPHDSCSYRARQRLLEDQRRRRFPAVQSARQSGHRRPTRNHPDVDAAVPCHNDAGPYDLRSDGSNPNNSDSRPVDSVPASSSSSDRDEPADWDVRYNVERLEERGGVGDESREIHPPGFDPQNSASSSSIAKSPAGDDGVRRDTASARAKKRRTSSAAYGDDSMGSDAAAMIPTSAGGKNLIEDDDDIADAVEIRPV